MEFRKIAKEHYSCFRKLLPELGKYYDGHENSKFFDQLVNKEGNDENGYFTRKKVIWTAYDNAQCLGFICLNYKRGGAVKIGPIIVSEHSRGRGIGLFLVNSALEVLKNEEVRKVYATTSSLNEAANRLFKRAGFRLEVELPDQYRRGSIECVWGFFLKYPTEIFVNNRSLLIRCNDEDKKRRVGKFNLKNDYEHLLEAVKIIKEWHDGIDKSFIDQIIKATKYGVDFELKGKIVLVTKDENSIFSGLAVATPKRGGAVKLYPLYGDGMSIACLVNKLKKIFYRDGFRKFYTFCHACDDDYIQKLIDLGFCLRGSILSPYKTGHDLAVLDLYIR